MTLGVGIEQGILAGIVLSLLFYIWQSSRPHTAELGYLAGRRAFLNVGRYPEAVRFEDVIILRVDSSLYFANMEFVGDILRDGSPADPTSDGWSSTSPESTTWTPSPCWS